MHVFHNSDVILFTALFIDIFSIALLYVLHWTHSSQGSASPIINLFASACLKVLYALFLFVVFSVVYNKLIFDLMVNVHDRGHMIETTDFKQINNLRANILHRQERVWQLVGCRAVSRRLFVEKASHLFQGVNRPICLPKNFVYILGITADIRYSTKSKMAAETL